VSAVQLLTIEQAGARLGIKSKSAVYALIANSALRAVDVAATGKRSRTRIREDDLQAFIDARTSSAPLRAVS
jgi:excisionase family DNA binding protein